MLLYKENKRAVRLNNVPMHSNVRFASEADNALVVGESDATQAREFDRLLYEFVRNALVDGGKLNDIEAEERAEELVNSDEGVAPLAMPTIEELYTINNYILATSTTSLSFDRARALLVRNRYDGSQSLDSEYIRQQFFTLIHPLATLMPLDENWDGGTAQLLHSADGRELVKRAVFATCAYDPSVSLELRLVDPRDYETDELSLVVWLVEGGGPLASAQQRYAQLQGNVGLLRWLHWQRVVLKTTDLTLTRGIFVNDERFFMHIGSAALGFLVATGAVERLHKLFRSITIADLMIRAPLADGARQQFVKLLDILSTIPSSHMDAAFQGLLFLFLGSVDSPLFDSRIEHARADVIVRLFKNNSAILGRIPFSNMTNAYRYAPSALFIAILAATPSYTPLDSVYYRVNNWTAFHRANKDIMRTLEAIYDRLVEKNVSITLAMKSLFERPSQFLERSVNGIRAAPDIVERFAPLAPTPVIFEWLVPSFTQLNGQSVRTFLSSLLTNVLKDDPAAEIASVFRDDFLLVQANRNELSPFALVELGELMINVGVAVRALLTPLGAAAGRLVNNRGDNPDVFNVWEPVPKASVQVLRVYDDEDDEKMIDLAESIATLMDSVLDDIDLSPQSMIALIQTMIGAQHGCALLQFAAHPVDISYAKFFDVTWPTKSNDMRIVAELLSETPCDGGTLAESLFRGLVTLRDYEGYAFVAERVPPRRGMLLDDAGLLVPFLSGVYTTVLSTFVMSLLREHFSPLNHERTRIALTHFVNALPPSPERHRALTTSLLDILLHRFAAAARDEYSHERLLFAVRLLATVAAPVSASLVQLAANTEIVKKRFIGVTRELVLEGDGSTLHLDDDELAAFELDAPTIRAARRRAAKRARLDS